VDEQQQWVNLRSSHFSRFKAHSPDACDLAVSVCCPGNLQGHPIRGEQLVSPWQFACRIQALLVRRGNTWDHVCEGPKGDRLFGIIYSQKIILYISDLEKLARSRNLPVIAAVGAKAERDVFGGFHRLCGIEVRQRYAERPYTPRRGEARLKKIDAELLDDRDVIASVQEAARNLPDWRIWSSPPQAARLDREGCKILALKPDLVIDLIQMLGAMVDAGEPAEGLVATGAGNLCADLTTLLRGNGKSC
jgi:hypothetical protein